MFNTSLYNYSSSILINNKKDLHKVLSYNNW